jgi:hypothetical protein
MHDQCMAVKTISLELDAYERLRRARLRPNESFSSVVRRAQWPALTPTAEELAESLRKLAASHPEMLLAPETLRKLERRSRTARRKTAWER